MDIDNHFFKQLLLRCHWGSSRCWRRWRWWWDGGPRGCSPNTYTWYFPVSTIGWTSTAQWDRNRSKFAKCGPFLCVWGCSPWPTKWSAQTDHLRLSCERPFMSWFGSFTQRRGFEGISWEPSEDVQATKRHIISDSYGLSVFNAVMFSYVFNVFILSRSGPGTVFES
jgi:hypothetical protein